MTRVLWLGPEVPEPGGSGGAMRSHHLLAGLVRQGLRPVVVTPTYPDQRERAEAARLDGVELRLVERPAGQAREALAAHLRHPGLVASLAARPFLGWQGDVFWTEIADTVRAVLAEEPPLAAAVVEHDFCARWALRLPGRLPAAFATHNATWVQLARDARAAHRPRRAALAVEAARYRRLVRGTLPRYSWFGAVSDQDAAALRELGVKHGVHVAPNGADVAALRDLPPGGGQDGRLLFTGTLSYPPNADAVRWLAADILPLVRRRVPDARLTVVGRGAPPDVQALAGEDLELLGWVDELAPVLQSAAVTLAPLRSGGGTRLKVLEALGAGRAMVATRIGAEGIDVVDGTHLRLADTPEAIADAIVDLLADPAERARLGAAGRALVEARYDWPAIADALGASLAEWVRRPPASR